MSGEELYDRYRTIWNRDQKAPAMPPWNQVHHAVVTAWNQLGADITTAITQADPVNPVTDDEIMSWIACQKPAVLKRLYFLLNRTGYRI